MENLMFMNAAEVAIWRETVAALLRSGRVIDAVDAAAVADVMTAVADALVMQYRARAGVPTPKPPLDEQRKPNIEYRTG